MRIGAYFPEDIDALNPINIEFLGNMGILRDNLVPEYSRTIFLDGPVAATGVIPLWAGVGQGWLLIDEAAPHTVTLVRSLRRALREIARQGPFHRIQADVKRDFQMGIRALLLGGFVDEGPMYAYTSEGVDYERLAYVDRDLLEIG